MHPQDVESQRTTKLLGSAGLLSLAFQSVGIIYGDIGTSPLYVVSGLFSDPPTEMQTLGSISFIIWSLTTVVLLKYCFLILWADDNGEGGTFALYSLLCRRCGLTPTGKPYTTAHLQSRMKNIEVADNFLRRHPGLQKAIAIVVLFGASLVVGDGIMTPAVSVLSAVEGLQIQFDNIEPAIVPITCVILIGLFFMQRFGTGCISFLFAPIVILWLVDLAIGGIINISKNPSAIRALSPSYAWTFFWDDTFFAWQSLGGVLLAVTGCEALFADLGHFNRPSIQLSATFTMYPALVLAYLGQGAQLILDPSVVSNTFWLTIPNGFYWPTFVLALLATIIASQAMISATFSIISQAMRLDCFPHLRIIHTSKIISGQIYISLINFILMVSCVVIVIIFKHSVNLTLAYGVCVAGVMFITDIMFTLVIIFVWGLPWPVAALYFTFYGIIDGLFLSSAMSKTLRGAWLPLGIAILLWLTMCLWRWGTSMRFDRYEEKQVRLDQLLEPWSKQDEESVNKDSQKVFLLNSNSSPGESGEQAPVPQLRNTSTQINGLRICSTGTLIGRTPGIAFFYAEGPEPVPRVFRHFLTRFGAAPRRVVFVEQDILAAATTNPNERIELVPLPIQGFYRANFRFGYADNVVRGEDFASEIMEMISRIEGQPLSGNDRLFVSNSNGSSTGLDTSFVVGNESIYARQDSFFLRRWLIEYGYRFLSMFNRPTKTDLPHEQVVEVGLRVVI